jgi:predicted membrane channel-forming protein YqfA (hemolysin III family)
MMQDFSFVHKYFMAEKQAGLLFLIIGSVAVLLSVVFFFFIKSNPSFYKGMAAPLIVIGLLQLVVGIAVFNRSDKQRMDVSYKIGMDPGFVKNTEQPRMEKVQQNFSIYKYAEIALLIAGIVLIVLYRTNADKSFWYGLGIALAIQCVICLTADVVAAKRGEAYLNRLKDMGSHK